VSKLKLIRLEACIDALEEGKLPPSVEPPDFRRGPFAQTGLSSTVSENCLLPESAFSLQRGSSLTSPILRVTFLEPLLADRHS
jgi:hypothetical protein